MLKRLIILGLSLLPLASKAQFRPLQIGSVPPLQIGSVPPVLMRVTTFKLSEGEMLKLSKIDFKQKLESTMQALRKKRPYCQNHLVFVEYPPEEQFFVSYTEHLKMSANRMKAGPVCFDEHHPTLYCLFQDEAYTSALLELLKHKEFKSYVEKSFPEDPTLAEKIKQFYFGLLEEISEKTIQ